MIYPVMPAVQRRILGRAAIAQGYHLLHDWGEGTVHLMRGRVSCQSFADETQPSGLAVIGDLTPADTCIIGRLRLACRADMARN